MNVSAAVLPIVVQFCTMLKLRLRCVFSTFGGHISRGLQMRVKDKGYGGLSDTYLLHLTANIPKTV